MSFGHFPYIEIFLVSINAIVLDNDTDLSKTKCQF